MSVHSVLSECYEKPFREVKRGKSVKVYPRQREREASEAGFLAPIYLNRAVAFRSSPSFPLTEALIFSRLSMPSAVYIEQFQLFVKAM